MVLADIPGLIEGAHAGRGLGNDFLRHVERCRLLVHVVDGAGSEGRDPVADFRLIEAELRARDPELAARPRVLVANKADLPDFEGLWPDVAALGDEVVGVFAISAATGSGTDALVAFLLDRLAGMPGRGPAVRREDAPRVITAPRRMAVLTATDGAWEVRDASLERLVAMADLENPEARDYLLRQMLRAGLPARLRQAGAQPGDPVRLGEWAGTVGEGGLPLVDADAALDD
jgi:GTP-binding protein